MSNELSIAQELGLAVTRPEKKAEGMVTGGKIVPWLKLVGSNSSEANKDPSLIGNYALYSSSSEFEKREKPILAYCLGFVYKAVRFEPNLEISYDPESELFRSIEAQANKGGDSGAQYGAEFMFCLEDGKVVTLLLGSKSARNKIPEFDVLVGKFCKIGAEFIDPPKSKYSWWCPAVSPTQDAFEITNIESINAEVNYLKNRDDLKAAGVEVVEGSSDSDSR